MSGAIDRLQRIGLKIFAAGRAPFDPRELVPVFHRWIQARAIDQLLISVADYAHLRGGPRVVLVAHEGNFALDDGGGRLGLVYYRKQPAGGPLPARLTSLSRTVLQAAALIEDDPALDGRLRFEGDALEFVANDRLLAPNNEASFEQMRAALTPLLTQLYPGATYSLSRRADPLERLTVSVKAPGPITITDLADRLS